MSLRDLRFLLAAGLGGLAVLGYGSSPARAATLFALTDTGDIFASSDQGQSWSLRTALAVHDAVALVAGQTSAQLFLAARTGTIYRSTDTGVNWIAVGAIEATDLVGIVVRLDGAILALTQSGTVYRSLDQGATWVAIAALSASHLTSLTRWNAEIFHALAETGEIERSTDNGVTWVPVGAISTNEARAIRAFGGALYVVTSSGETWKSTDAGASWNLVGTLSQVGTVALTDDGTTLVAATEHGLVATSINGNGWNWRGSTNQVRLSALGTDIPVAVSVPVVLPEPRITMTASVPNPWDGRGDVNFRFSLRDADRVRLEVYDAVGRFVTSRPAQQFSAGHDLVLRWTPGSLEPGVYFARIVTSAGDRAQNTWVALR